MLKTNNNQIWNNQRGVVSILVSVIIMIILTLIAVGFAQIMRREQRQSLDRQLSAQAFYAAESAINDASYAYANGEISGSYNNCQSPDGLPLSKNVLDQSLEVSYTCVTLESNIGSVEFDSVSMDNTKQIELFPTDVSGANQELADMNIFWQSSSSNSFAPEINATDPLLPKFSGWPVGQPGMLRVEIIPLRGRGTSIYTRSTLMNSSDVAGRKVFFLYPSGGGSLQNIDWSDASTNGKVYGGNCNTMLARPKNCNVNITNLPATANNSYIVRMKSIYKPTSASIRGTLSSGTDAYFKDAQVAIDATGKANDVLRRVRAYISIDESYPIPENGVQSYEGLCKLLQLYNQDDISYNCPKN